MTPRLRLEIYDNLTETFKHSIDIIKINCYEIFNLSPYNY